MLQNFKSIFQKMPCVGNSFLSPMIYSIWWSSWLLILFFTEICWTLNVFYWENDFSSFIYKEKFFNNRGRSRQNLGPFSSPFIKFYIEKTTSSQNSVSKKWPLHKILHRKNGSFTKFHCVKSAFLQNSNAIKTTFS